MIWTWPGRMGARSRKATIRSSSWTTFVVTSPAPIRQNGHAMFRPPRGKLLDRPAVPIAIGFWVPGVLGVDRRPLVSASRALATAVPVYEVLEPWLRRR